MSVRRVVRRVGVRYPRASEHAFMVLAAILTGLGGGLGALLFRFLIGGLGEVFFGDPAVWLAAPSRLLGVADVDLAAAAEDLSWGRRLLAPTLGGLIVGPLVYYFAREARGHGVPEVMEAVARRGGLIRPRVAAVKILASGLSIGSGGSVGREGPIVQIGSALASSLGQALRVPVRHLRTLVGCGAAAGIAATFNAPIAGALFAVEIILGDFAVPQFTPIVIASVVATVVSRFFLGDSPAFRVPDYELVSPFELGPYLVLGLVAAGVGVLFVSLLYATEDRFDALPVPEPLKAGIGGLGVGAVALAFPQVYGVGYATIDRALDGSLPIALLAVLLPAKLVATSVTLGSGGSGGIFAPSLFLGAMLGGLFGSVVHGLFPEWTASSGAYALVAMGAVVSAATQAPITAIVIIFELTQTIHIVPPLMAACVVSTLVATMLRRESIYSLKLRRRGVDLFAPQEADVLKGLSVADVLDRRPTVVHASTSFADIVDLVVQSPHTAFFVVDDRSRFLGTVPVSELRRLLHESDALRTLVVAADLIDVGRPAVTQSDDLATVAQLLSSAHASELAVVDAEDPTQLLGLVHERSVLDAYEREVLHRDLVGGMSTRLDLAERGYRVRVGSGYVVAEVETPPAFVGYSLRDLDLRARRGVEVLLLRRRDETDADPAVRLPSADDRIQEGDRLLVAGPESAVERLRSG